MYKLILFAAIYSFHFCEAQKSFSLEDSLRGSVTKERVWWDLIHYSLKVNVDIKQKFISGENVIRYKVLNSQQVLQLDLQSPMIIKNVFQDGLVLNFEKNGKNAYFILLQKVQKIGNKEALVVEFEGHPKTAVRAPWDGGFSWSKDEKGRDFVATSCQELGSSVWWPCKDHMYDEPDSMRMSVTVPDSLWDISNGRMTKMCINANGSRTTDWEIRNPINNYGVNINIGNYVHFSEVFAGENGNLTMDYFVLPENLEKAKVQFKDASRMMKAFEYWFGPYPFYEDGYKLVEVPYLGMEHQSSITYGNKYANGYLGKDLSGTGWGSKWDFIIIHESGHEWFANNITYKDIADMWIHESFTNYSETLFTEFHYGKKAGQDYVIGTRSSIKNDSPIIGVYNLNKKGSVDMYSKGGNLIHTIRHIISDDDKFRQILRGLNKEFYHQTVDTKQIEDYISTNSGIDFSKVFNQYLRDTRVPKLEQKITKNQISYRWINVVPGFEMPLKVTIDGIEQIIKPTSVWKNISGNQLLIDRNFYVK